MGELIVIGIALACLALIFILMGAGVISAEDGAWSALANTVVLLVQGRAKRRLDERKERKQAEAQKKAGGVLLVLVSLMATGCSSTFTGATSKAAIAGHGASGLTAVLTVDGRHVCTATGNRSALRVDERTARRICDVHKDAGCTWVTP